MRKKHAYIPNNAGEFDTFFKNLTQYVALKASGSKAVWKHIPSEAQNNLYDAYRDWFSAYTLTLKPHTKIERMNRRIAYTDASKIIRIFVRQYLRFPPVTDNDRTAMDINNYDTVKTMHYEVPEVVDATTKLKDIRTILLDFKVKGAESKAKPDGYNGALVAWDVLDEPPEQPEDLTRKKLASRTPHLIEFNERERGKTAYIALAWQNKRGILGKWSKIHTAIVP